MTAVSGFYNEGCLDPIRHQREVAALVSLGLTNRQVAKELSISEHTAATHVRQILKKLGFRSKTQIAAWLMEEQPLP